MRVQPVLVLDSISFGYHREKPVLAEVGLSLYPGSVTAILGPNGAGKTTLLHVVLGLLTPQSGIIRLAGQSLRTYPRQELARWIGLVPQREHVPFDYSVLEYVLLGRAPYLHPLEQPGQKDIEIARQSLERLEIDHLKERVVTELSGGELQLVLIARSLAQEPRILLLDEPTSHLDLANQFRVSSMIRRLASQGVTILFTTHNPEEASGTANQLVLMRGGRVLDQGPVEQMFTAEKLSQTYGVPVQVVRVDGHHVAVPGGDR